MFDIGWSELLVLGALALIVVGPKDLPGMLRSLGQIAGKARGMAREFQRTMEDAAREADLDELRDVQKSMKDWNSKIGADAPRKYAESILKGEDDKKAPEAGSLDAADDAENAAWEAEQAAKAAKAEKLAQVDRDAAELEAEATRPDPAPEAAPSDEAKRA